MKQSRALTYEEATHRIGRIWMLSAAALFLLVPVSVSIFYDAWPPIKLVGEGLLGVAPIFWTVGVIEAFTFIPMLGSGGSYLAFVTGNLTNLKVPCVLNALQAAKIDPGTEKAEAVSTIAVAVSSIVTTLIIALGVILLGSVQPILQSPALAPAFENILPALFGALAVVFVSQAWKIPARIHDGAFHCRSVARRLRWRAGARGCSACDGHCAHPLQEKPALMRR